MSQEKLRLGITGGSGFIGSRLVEYLSKDQKIEFFLFDGDLLNKQEISSFFEGKEINQVVHLAGTFFGDFEELVLANVITTSNLLQVAVKRNVSKFVYTSTGAVYGEPVREKAIETDPLNPITLYGLAKAYAEKCVDFYSRKFAINSIILRFPNVYGPQNNKGVIYDFLKAIKEKGRVVIHGTGQQKRNFLFVDDAVEAIKRAIEYDGEGEVFNIADKDLFSLNDVLEILRAKGLRFTIDYQPTDESNSLQVLSEDITKANNLIKWQPMVGLSDALERMLSDF